MRHVLERRWSSDERNSSCSCIFSALAPDAVRFEEVLHGGSNFYSVCLCRKMAGVKELNLRTRQVFPKSFGSCGNEERIILAPDREQRRLRLAEILLEFRIELYVRGIIQKQIELDVFIAGTLQQSSVQSIGFRRDDLRISNSMRVLPACAFKGQQGVADNLAVLGVWLRPIAPNRIPGIAQAF